MLGRSRLEIGESKWQFFFKWGGDLWCLVERKEGKTKTESKGIELPESAETLKWESTYYNQERTF